MIKLNRPPAPSCLAENEVQKLTSLYKETKKSVWNFDELKQALLATSHNKCAYCECDLSKESKYMEVEHFHDKDKHPERVVDWLNLLPACKRCNGAKGTHNVSEEPIVNPYENNPREHFSFSLYRLKAKSDLGKNTLDVLGLNDTDRVVKVRFEIGEWINESLLTALDYIETYINNRKSTKTKNRLISLTRELLSTCQVSSAYAANAATVLHNNDHYKRLKNELQNLDIWNQELQELHSKSLKITLDNS